MALDAEAQWQTLGTGTPFVHGNKLALSYGLHTMLNVVCEQEGIGFIPWFPLATGALCKPGGPLDSIVHELDATPSQVALAWLLRRSPVMLPIPGTSTVAHLEDNLAAADIELSDEQFAQITQSVS